MEKYINTIISMYKDGHTIEHISKFIFKTINRSKNKFIILQGTIIIRPVDYSLSQVRIFVAKTIYSHILASNCATF